MTPEQNQEYPQLTPEQIEQYTQWVFDWGYEDAMCGSDCLFPQDPDYGAGFRAGTLARLLAQSPLPSN